MNALDRLDAARSALSEDAQKALRLLPAASALPGALRLERDFVEAEARRAMGFFKAAEKLYARVLKGAKGASDAVLRAEAALGSASGLRALGQVAAAGARIAVAKKAGVKGLAERIELEDALILRAGERYDEALKRLRPLLHRALSRKAFDEAAYLLWAVGGAHRFLGQLSKSEEAFRLSLAFARRAKDPVGEGYALFGIGGAARVRGNLLESERAYAAAEKLFAPTSDVFARAYASCGRSNALRQLGRLAEAEKGYQQAYALYSSLGDAVDLAYVDWGWGEVLMKKGDLKAALKRFEAGEKAFRVGHETRGIVLSLHSRARVFHALGRTAEAEKLFSQGVALARKAGIHTHLESFT